MAAAVEWSELALEDLRQIVLFVGASRPSAARLLGERLVQLSEQAGLDPLACRVVPEFQLSSLREAILPPFRLVFSHEPLGKITVLRVWHSARGTPALS